MAEQTKLGQKPEENPGGLRCEEWEQLLADALDGHLTPAQAATFAAHSAGCPACADLLAHVRQGREWLGYLHTEPEVPGDLVSRILDKTVGAGAVPVPVLAGAGQGTGVAAAAIPWRRNFHEMRLLMTVAMAFFSIALTLNLAGIKLSNLHMADLRPSTIGGALSRQFYGAQGSVVKFYNNLRFVYQLESRMRELRRDVDTTPATPHQQKNAPAKPSGGNDGFLTPGPGWGAIVKAHAWARRSTEIETKDAELSTGLPQDVNCKTADQTEASILNFPGSTTAGPRRSAEIAGYDGRSLA
ncbi:MAG: anti-sigma factor [Acidobacteriaceae bacterium]